MNEELARFKEALINSGAFKRTATRRDEYRGKICPRCGDVKWHTYLKIDVTNESPVVWHCFKCNEAGIVNKEFLKAYDLSINTPRNVKYHKQIDVQEAVSTKLNNVSVTDTDDVSNVSQYIQSRVGIIPTMEELQMFRYVGNPFKYVNEYFGDGINKHMDQRCWFQLTNGNIIGRCYNDETEYRWLRYQTKKVRGRGLYTMRRGLDTHQVINIVISEGIMDSIGLYYHYPIENAIYISTLGSDYKAGIQHMMKLGIFGDSVIIHIFKDSDVSNDMIKIPIGLQKLFKHIFLYQNTIGKDYGVFKEELDIHKIKKIK